MNSSRTAALGVGIALTLGLALTGCGGTTPPASSGAAPSAAASDDGSGSGDATVALPDGFPSADVPIIDGTIVAANHPGKIWAVWVASSDLPGDLAKATQLLVDAGYQNVIATAEYGDFHGTKYQVHVTAKDDPKYGSTIAYAFYEVQ